MMRVNSFAGKVSLLILSALLVDSCSSTRYMNQGEDVMIITRKYVGVYLDYRTSDYNFFHPEIIWVKTSMDSYFGKIGVYSKAYKELEYTVGERLYVRRSFYSRPGIEGVIYTLESNDGKVSYKIYSTNKNPDPDKAMRELFEDDESY